MSGWKRRYGIVRTAAAAVATAAIVARVVAAHWRTRHRHRLCVVQGGRRGRLRNG